MRNVHSSRNPELRGDLVGLAMLMAAALVFGGIVAIVYIQEIWVVALTVVLEVAVIVGGVLWIAPVVSQGEVPDSERPAIEGEQVNVVPLERRRTEPPTPPEHPEHPEHPEQPAPSKPADHTPRIAA